MPTEIKRSELIKNIGKVVFIVTDTGREFIIRIDYLYGNTICQKQPNGELELILPDVKKDTSKYYLNAYAD